MPNEDISTMLGAASPYSPAAGPFSNVLQSGLQPGAQPQPSQRPSGFMGTTGKLAFFGTKILEGIQKGRALSYMRSETAKENEFKGQMIDLSIRMQDATPDQKVALQKIQGQLVQMHLGNALDDGTDKDSKGKPKKKSSSPAGDAILSRGPDTNPEAPGEKVKGFLKEMLTGLGGGKMPETKDTKSWLSSQLSAIGDPPGLNQQIKDRTNNIQNAAAAAKQARPDITAEEISQLDAVQKNSKELLSLYGNDARKLNDTMGAILPGYKTKEQQLHEEGQSLQLRQQKLTVEEQENENKDREQVFNAGVQPSSLPPEARTSGNPGRNPGSLEQGPPSVAPIPPQELTSRQQVAMRYAAPGSNELFGQALQFRSTSPPKGSTVFATKDGHEMTLLSLGTNRNGEPVMVQPGTYRLFNYSKAEKDGGWQFDDKQPPRVPLDKFVGEYGSSGKLVWFKHDKDGKSEPMRDDKGNPIVARIDKTMEQNQRVVFGALTRARQSHNTATRKIVSDYNDKVLAAKNGTFKGQPLTKPLSVVLKELSDDRDEALADNQGQFSDETTAIYGAMGIEAKRVDQGGAAGGSQAPESMSSDKDVDSFLGIGK